MTLYILVLSSLYVSNLVSFAQDVESETVCGKDESSGQRAHTESDSIPLEKQCDSSQEGVMESLQEVIHLARTHKGQIIHCAK